MKTAVSVLGILVLFLTTACKKDPCKNVSCQNGGTCNDGKCNCNLPWEGTKCEVDAREKFVGSWSGTESCSGNNENVSLGITKSSVEAISIIIENQIRGQLTSSTTFTIPTQQIVSGGMAINVSGNGVLNGNVLTMNITLSQGGQGITCVYTLTRL